VGLFPTSCPRHGLLYNLIPPLSTVFGQFIAICPISVVFHHSGQRYPPFSLESPL
jgi:hypothetical protein